MTTTKILFLIALFAISAVTADIFNPVTLTNVLIGVVQQVIEEDPFDSGEIEFIQCKDEAKIFTGDFDKTFTEPERVIKG